MALQAKVKASAVVSELKRRYTNSEPKPRFSHYSGAVGGKCVVFAGRAKDFVKLKTQKELSSNVEIFDQYEEDWKTSRTIGISPNGLYLGGCCVSPSGQLYVYGGTDGLRWYGGLYKLTSMEWKQLSLESDPGCPSPKAECQIAFFDDKKIAVIGGYGPPPDVLQPVSGIPLQLEDLAGGVEWNNVIYVFDTEQYTWSAPIIKGTTPPLLCGFTLTSIDKHRGLLFGGKEGEYLQRTSDLYLINFQTMEITKLEKQGEQPWPVERALHAACCLGFNSKNPHLLVTGGIDNDGKTLNDAWLFNVYNKSWKQLVLLDPDVLSRNSHSITAISLIPSLIEVTVFGGCSLYNPTEEVKKLAETTVLAFEYCDITHTWKLIDVATNAQLGTKERIKEKIEKIKQFGREAESEINSDDNVHVAQVHCLKDAVQKEPLQPTEEPQQVVQTAIKQAERAEEYEQEIHQLKEQIEREKEEKKQLQNAMEVSTQQLNETIRQKEQRLECSELRIQEAEDELRELQSHWIISKSEIELTKECLGNGAYGEVVVAMFRGCRVAAKRYHHILLSDHNMRLFRREIAMATRLHHPNLVQFIGAVTGSELILVTELMTTSLGAMMHRGPLSESTIKSISLDIAKALNYLHLMQPHPIIHRDICSGNVLLDPLPDNLWKAKVSDYGSVNLLQLATTAYPGNRCYAAPESQYRDRQTPKMDTFSFGILLSEMLTNELVESEKRQGQLSKIALEHPNFARLVRECLSEDMDVRPSAQLLIVCLSEL